MNGLIVSCRWCGGKKTLQLWLLQVKVGAFCDLVSRGSNEPIMAWPTKRRPVRCHTRKPSFAKRQKGKVCALLKVFPKCNLKLSVFSRSDNSKQEYKESDWLPVINNNSSLIWRRQQNYSKKLKQVQLPLI